MLQLQSASGAFALLDHSGRALFRGAIRVLPEPPVGTATVASAPAGPRLDELLIRVNAPGLHLDEVVVELTATEEGAALLDGEAKVLPLGGFEVAGRGVRRWTELRDQAEGEVNLPALGALVHSGALSLLVGAGGVPRDFGALRTAAAALEFVFRVGRPLREGEEWRLALGTGSDPWALLTAYGDALARHGGRVRETPTGWNSWDYYQGAVTMDDLRAEMAAINASPLRGKLRYLVIDMGWENCWGDWRPNRKFPKRPAAIAAAIRAAGFEPGIWLAPLQASTYLPAARHDRARYLRDASGEPVVAQGHGACLLHDPTHPDTEAWLRETCAGLREAGFSLFKVDYLYRNYFDLYDQPHEAATGRAEIPRRFLQIIRDTIGPEAHLLSCGAPLPSALGLADSARISTDIHNFWGHVRNSAVQIAGTQWLNGRLWVNDPDFALIRSPATSADPYLNPPYARRPYTDPAAFWMAGNDASAEELRTWLSLVHLCGGSLFAGDSIARLNARGLSELDRLFSAPVTAPAVPLDLFSGEPPRWWLTEEAGATCLGVFNWSDEPSEVPLPGNTPASGVDYWTGERLQMGSAVVLPAHGALVVRC